MYNFTSLKFSIIAIVGAVLSVLGWYHVAATKQIFTGFAQGGPACLIIGAAIFAAPQLGFYRGAGIGRRLSYILCAVVLAFVAAVANYQVMKLVYPHAAVTDQIDMPEGMAR